MQQLRRLDRCAHPFEDAVFILRQEAVVAPDSAHAEEAPGDKYEEADSGNADPNAKLLTLPSERSVRQRLLA
eukprot:2098097-Prymnesium_polylepis.4